MEAKIEMFTVICAHCGMVFAMPDEVNQNLRKCHNTFYCPSGHAQSYPQKSDEEKLRDQLRIKNDEIMELKEKERIRLEKQRNRKKKKVADEK